MVWTVMGWVDQGEDPDDLNIPAQYSHELVNPEDEPGFDPALYVNHDPEPYCVLCDEAGVEWNDDCQVAERLANMPEASLVAALNARLTGRGADPVTVVPAEEART